MKNLKIEIRANNLPIYAKINENNVSRRNETVMLLNKLSYYFLVQIK